MSGLRESLILHEDIRGVPYPDPLGLWTVGVGRCLERNPLTGPEWKALLDRRLISFALSNAGSMLLLDNDLLAAQQLGTRSFEFWPRLDEMRRDVLIEMVFQMGIAGVLQFRTMLSAVSRGDWAAAAAAGLDSLWAKQTPARASALMRQLEGGV